MNVKNLIMWVIIVLLSVGLFNMFQDPNKIDSQKNSLPFSNFLISRAIHAAGNKGKAAPPPSMNLKKYCEGPSLKI